MFIRSRLAACVLPFAILTAPALSSRAAAQVPPHIIPETVTKSSTHETTTADILGIDASTSKCAIADDATYGYSAENPIKTGGGIMYGPVREVRHLWILRGPAGQGLHFRRARSEPGPDRVTILDVYTVDYPGLEKPLVLYLDEYHWDSPKAPKGLTCGLASDLTPPGPDPMDTQTQWRSLGLELAAAPPPPIPIDQDGSTTHGIVLDYVRVIAQAGKTALAEGRPFTADNTPSGLNQQHLVVVAYPLTCEGRTILPQTVTLSDANGAVPPVHAQATGAQVRALTQGFAVPESSIAIAYRTLTLINGAKITIRYAEPPCQASSPDVVLPVKVDPPQLIRRSTPVIPAGVDAAPNSAVNLRVAVGLDNRLRYPAYLSGPPQLMEAAIAAVKDWQIEPPLMNGVPTILMISLGVTFAVQ